DLIFLGTASSYPSPHRCASGLIVRFHADGDCWLFDCGESTQVQLMRSPVKLGRISRIFITHLHGDHSFGLPGLISTLGGGRCEAGSVLTVCGPPGTRQFLRQSLAYARSDLVGIRLAIRELAGVPLLMPAPENAQMEAILAAVASDSPQGLLPALPYEIDIDDADRQPDGTWTVVSDQEAAAASGGVTVQAAALSHRVPCVGYRLATRAPATGHLQPELAYQLGLARSGESALLGELKRGRTVTTRSGAVIRPEQATAAPPPPLRLAVFGDTCNSDLAADMCRGVDCVVHEATGDNSLTDSCLEKGHSTPAMAAQFARQVGAKCLLLTHFSQRYTDGAGPTVSDASVELLRRQAEAALDGSGIDLRMAADLRQFAVTHEGVKFVADHG
ncbi:hypothetical protein BOX15_Mlig001820g2, partial [Macrostomum lignano]